MFVVTLLPQPARPRVRWGPPLLATVHTYYYHVRQEYGGLSWKMLLPYPRGDALKGFDVSDVGYLSGTAVLDEEVFALVGLAGDDGRRLLDRLVAASAGTEVVAYPL